MPQPQEPPKTSNFGPAFNATGRDDTSTEILTPKLDPGVRSRRTTLIALLVLVGGVMLYYSYLRNPINPSEMPHGTGFGDAKNAADRERKPE